jgi:hypothetical protein
MRLLFGVAVLAAGLGCGPVRGAARPRWRGTGAWCSGKWASSVAHLARAAARLDRTWAAAKYARRCARVVVPDTRVRGQPL